MAWLGRFRLAAALALGVMLVAPDANAQGPPGRPLPPISAQSLPRPPSASELQPAEQLEKAAGRKTDFFAPAGAGACPLRGSDLKFTLHSVTFHNLTAVSQAEMARSWRGLGEQEIPVSAICDIRDRASDILYRHGILARVEIPEQKISGGALTFEVIEARIDQVQVRGDAGPAQAKVEAYIEKLRGLRPFDLGTAQRYLLLATDVPGVRLSATLRPSGTDRGAVDLEVTVARDWFNAMAAVQNHGSEAAGPWSVLGRTDFQGLTRFGERTSLVVYTTPDDEQRVVQAIAEVPIWTDGLRLLTSGAYGIAHPGDTLAPLDLESRSVVGDLALSYPLIRARRRNLDLVTGFAFIDQTTKFASKSVLSEDRLRIAYARVSANQSFLALERPAQLRGAVEVRQGLDVLNASQPLDFAMSRFEGDPQAFVARLQAGLDYDLTRRLSISARILGQYAAKPLLSYEELAFGALTIGRGYDPAAATGDRGVAGSLEVRAGPFQISRLRVAGYAFYDAARLSDLDRDAEDRSLASTGAGLRLALTDLVNLDIAYAHPLDKTLPTAKSKPSPRILVSLVARLF